MSAVLEPAAQDAVNRVKAKVILENDSGEKDLSIEDVVPLSKNKLKKLRRDAEWEAGREARKLKRKEKVKEQKLKKKQQKDSAGNKEQRQKRQDGANDRTISTDDNKAINGEDEGRAQTERTRPLAQHVQLPITIILDCSFDELMHDKERKSLGSQITRCYSDNHRAPYQAHMVVSSFGGHLQARFDGLLAGTHQSWRNVRFYAEDCAHVAKLAPTWMSTPASGILAEPLSGVSADAATRENLVMDLHEMKSEEDIHSSGSDEIEGETIYLSSDSPNTLTQLKPNSTYIIGGLVDRNRHKGVCHQRATEMGIKTAKLPIGEYLQMTSRFVLATNHVMEIMLRWLEHGDWGRAFVQVIPRRKGGILKVPADGPSIPACDEDEVKRVQVSSQPSETSQICGEATTMEHLPEA